MDNVVLTDVHKIFPRRYGAATVRQQQMTRGRASGSDEALAGVSLTLAPGDVLGVVGRRGAGRSTLLSVVQGLYRPDRGEVMVRGRTGGLVSMGAGFAGYLSVESAMQINAGFLGMTRDQLERARPDVLEFAGLGGAALGFPMREIDAPRRRRLAYAMAVASAPNVFLADGLVAVGGEDERNACLARLESLAGDGHTLVVATNRAQVLRRLATKVLVLDAGHVSFLGRTAAGIKHFKKLRRQTD